MSGFRDPTWCRVTRCFSARKANASKYGQVDAGHFDQQSLKELLESDQPHYLRDPSSREPIRSFARPLRSSGLSHPTSNTDANLRSSPVRSSLAPVGAACGPGPGPSRPAPCLDARPEPTPSRGISPIDRPRCASECAGCARQPSSRPLRWSGLAARSTSCSVMASVVEVAATPHNPHPRAPSSRHMSPTRIARMLGPEKVPN